MKAFRFTLEAVQTLRHRQEQQAMELYVRALLARQQALDRLEIMRERIRRNQQEMSRLLSAGCAGRASRPKSSLYERSLEKQQADRAACAGHGRAARQRHLSGHGGGPPAPQNGGKFPRKTTGPPPARRRRERSKNCWTTWHRAASGPFCRGTRTRSRVMTKLLTNPWMSVPAGRDALSGLHAPLLEDAPPCPPRPKSAEPPVLLGASWEFTNPEADQLDRPNSGSEESAWQCASSRWTNWPSAPPAPSGTELAAADAGRSGNCRMDFDQSVVRVQEDEESPNLKKLAKVYAGMSPACRRHRHGPVGRLGDRQDHAFHEGDRNGGHPGNSGQERGRRSQTGRRHFRARPSFHRPQRSPPNYDCVLVAPLRGQTAGRQPGARFPGFAAAPAPVGGDFLKFMGRAGKMGAEAGWTSPLPAARGQSAADDSVPVGAATPAKTPDRTPLAGGAKMVAPIVGTTADGVDASVASLLLARLARPAPPLPEPLEPAKRDTGVATDLKTAGLGDAEKATRAGGQNNLRTPASFRVPQQPRQMTTASLLLPSVSKPIVDSPAPGFPGHAGKTAPRGGDSLTFLGLTGKIGGEGGRGTALPAARGQSVANDHVQAGAEKPTQTPRTAPQAGGNKTAPQTTSTTANAVDVSVASPLLAPPAAQTMPLPEPVKPAQSGMGAATNLKTAEPAVNGQTTGTTGQNDGNQSSPMPRPAASLPVEAKSDDAQSPAANRANPSQGAIPDTAKIPVLDKLTAKVAPTPQPTVRAGEPAVAEEAGPSIYLPVATSGPTADVVDTRVPSPLPPSQAAQAAPLPEPVKPAQSGMGAATDLKTALKTAEPAVNGQTTGTAGQTARNQSSPMPRPAASLPVEAKSDDAQSPVANRANPSQGAIPDTAKTPVLDKLTAKVAPAPQPTVRAGEPAVAEEAGTSFSSPVAPSGTTVASPLLDVTSGTDHFAARTVESRAKWDGGRDGFEYYFEDRGTGN